MSGGLNQIRKVIDFEKLMPELTVKTNKRGDRTILIGDWKVRVEKLSLMYAARELLKQDHPATLRRPYYMLFGDGWIPNSQAVYKGVVIPAMVEARQRRIIPWDWLEDLTREPRGVQMHDDIWEFQDNLEYAYKRDIWETQPVYIEVWVEKRADLSHVMAAARPWRVTVNAGNGYDGWSSIYEAQKRFQKYSEMGKTVHVLYLGDYDPSGLHMLESLRERLGFFDCHPTVHRLGVNREDIDEYNLPEWPGKESDARANWMRERYGEVIQVELDALPVAVMKEKVDIGIRELIDHDRWDRTMEIEDKERRALRESLGWLSESLENIE